MPDYKIIIQDAAIADAKQYAAYILEQSKNREVAARWVDELEEVIGTLAKMPKRYKIIQEQEEFAIELRQVLHYSHRVVYHINEKLRAVHVLRVYHSAKKPILPDNLPLIKK